MFRRYALLFALLGGFGVLPLLALAAPPFPLLQTAIDPNYGCHIGTNGWGSDSPVPPNTSGTTLCNSEVISGTWRVGYFSAQNTSAQGAPSAQYAVTSDGHAYTLSPSTSTVIYAQPGDPIYLEWSFQPALTLRALECTGSFLGICYTYNNVTYASYTFFDNGITSNFGQSAQYGSATITAPAQSTSYTIGGVTVPQRCHPQGAGKEVCTTAVTTTLSIPIVIGNPPAAPSLTFASNPITVGQSTTATWSVSNATNCALSNSYGGVSTAARVNCGASVITPTPTYATTTTDTFTLQYTDTSGTNYFPTYVLVVNSSSSSDSLPGCSTSSQGCGPTTSDNNGSSSQSTSAPSFAPPPAPLPALTLSINPARVQKGKTAIITWSATNAPSCTLAGPGVSTSCDRAAACAASTQTPTAPINAASTYTLTCGDVSRSQTVNLLPSVKEI